jgi:[protein-PII] uridylyltransferase
MTQAQSSVVDATPLLEKLSSKLVPELKRYVKHHRGSVQEMIAASDMNSGMPASRRYAKVIDGLASALFHAAHTAMLGEGTWHPVALGAVGSYGRNSLSIFSDLDVRLLCMDRPEAVQPIAEALLYPLWDAGLSIGHQVVTSDDVIELAKTDLPTATSLLDWRHLAGERSLSEAFVQRAFDEVFGLERVGDFLARLSKSAHDRKERFGGSVFLLEPDLKNGAGGLRDLDLAHWAARARWRTRGLEELVRVGVLLPDEWAETEKAIDFVVRVRNALHLRKSRRVDRLGFEEQEQLAEVFRYGKGGRAVEAFMSDYYRQAREIERMSEMVLRRATPPPKTKPMEVSLGNGLRQLGEQIAFDDYDAIYGEPALAFHLYEEAIKRELGVNDASRRALTRAVGTESFCEQLRADKRSAESFRRLVCCAKETRFKYGSILTELHDVGLLLAMIPEFAPVVGRVHHDVYHVYTVDVHSIAAVDRMRAVFRGALEESLVLATRLAKECTRPEVVYFATLLHDVGKDTGGRKHAERGAELALGILTRLRFDPVDIAAVQHLVAQHLKMYLVGTRRDIDDPKTLEGFSREVTGQSGLQELYLLTIADVSTTSPTALNSWKLRMLDELYHATHKWLAEGESRDAAKEAVELQVLGALPKQVSRELASAFLNSMPARYLGANSSEWITRHLELAEAAADEPAVISVLRRGHPHVELAVVANDQPGLLAQICAVFSERKFKVVGAQIYSWTDPTGRKRALDLFWVRSGLDPQAVVELVPKLNQSLRRVLAGETRALDLVSKNSQQVRWSSRPSPAVPIQVRVDNEGASRHTILEVITKDRADLLFWISETIYETGLTIDLAKIHTEGVRVTDVFYVCTKDGRKLLDEERIDALRDLLTARLRELEGDQK